jgi:uncharacterized membrane protein (DUF4010 family)
MTYSELFLRYGVSIVIGFLIGLQREFSYGEADKNHALGVRTISLMGLLGCAGAHMSSVLNSVLPFVTVLVVVGAFLVVNYFVEAPAGHLGLTTKVTGILTVLTGGLAYVGQIPLAVALGVAATVILSVKPEMHRLVKHITREDIYATLKFAVITAIVLPVLPNRTFGPPPFDILNPLKIWLLVVFISGISFVGYVLIKVIGTRKGIGLTGVMGGLVSSTAVTLSFTQRSKGNEQLSRPFALAIIVAWTIMFFRVIAAVAVLNASLVGLIWLPLLVPAAVGLGYCVYLFLVQKPDREHEGVAFSNPFELGPAIKFGLLFVVILLVSKVAQVYLGNTGVYLSSFVSGLADVDAIALSMAKLSRPGAGVAPVVAAQAIVLAAVANTLLKGSIVIFAGSTGLRKAILPGFILILATGVIAVFLI